MKALKAQIAAANAAQPVAETAAPVVGRGRTPGRVGKKAVVGHFSEAMSHALNVQALDERTTIQALMGEAWDDLRKKRGLPPFGEH